MANGQQPTAGLIDSHCHLADPAFAGDLPQVLERAWAEGLTRIVVIGESRASAERALALAGEEPRLSATAGVHPHDASGWNPEAAEWLRKSLRDPRVVAAGEMGLDYHYDHSPREVQRAVFDEQLSIAEAAGKPAVIHAREADDDVAAVLRNHPRATAILHSFSSGPELLRAAVRMGHYVSFSGMVTFKNWRLDPVIPEIPIDRLLVETDAPYLAPVPQRGRRNEPAFVRFVAARLASVLGASFEAAAVSTSRNAIRVFQLEHDPR
ncbi:MAG: TatD family hydrolase [Gemmatimonadota bacterium]